MPRASTALLATAALALLASARAAMDGHNHDHDHDHRREHADADTDTKWACTAACGADYETATVRPRRHRDARWIARWTQTRNAGFLTRPPSPRANPLEHSQHPCGAGKLIPNPTLQTCALTYENIMSDDDLKTATHVVACPSSVCAAQCSAEGASGSFNCFDNTNLMDSTKLAANERALAMGCTGSHEMNNMFMAGPASHDCKVGHNHNDYMEAVSAADERKTISFAAAAVAAGAALMRAA